MAPSRRNSGRCGRVLGGRDEGVGPGKPLTVAQLLAEEATAEALETDFLHRYGVDLLDLYRGDLSYRRVCALVTHLPSDAAVWRLHGPRTGWTRAELLAAATERRLTALWATVAVALGHDITDEQLADPLDALDQSAPLLAQTGAPEVKPLREIALWMRNG